jgi:hypothetical protein
METQSNTTLCLSGNYTGGQTMNLNASTTYYLCGYLSNIGGGTNLYYNNFDFNFSLNVNTVTSGGSAGAGGAGASYNASAGNGSSGGSGGTNAGSGGAGGNGGALGAAGSNGTAGGNGSGTGISFPSTAPANGSSASSDPAFVPPDQTQSYYNIKLNQHLYYLNSHIHNMLYLRSNSLFDHQYNYHSNTKLCLIGFPSNSKIISPGLIPPLSDGLLSATLATRAPLGLSSFSASAIPSETS